MPVGQVIPVRDGDVRRELLLVAYLHSADGARFTVGGGRFHGLTAVDDHRARYQLECRWGHSAAVLMLRPDPPRHIRWLDLATGPGEATIRIDLDLQVPAPDLTVTRTAHDPGELLLDVIAARILCSGAVAFPHYDLEHPPVGAADLRAFIGDGPGRIVAALHASGALPPASPVPGQLAALCTRVGIPGHGITAPPAAGLPEPWQHMLTYPRLPQAGPAPGIAAAAAAAAGTPPGPKARAHHRTAAKSSCGLGSCPRWSAPPAGSMWSPPADRPRPGSGCRCAGRETLNAIPECPRVQMELGVALLK